jgi:hypothetical protein
MSISYAVGRKREDLLNIEWEARFKVNSSYDNDHKQPDGEIWTAGANKNALNFLFYPLSIGRRLS